MLVPCRHLVGGPRKQGLASSESTKIERVAHAWASDTLHWLLSIDHPRNAVAIDTHAKARRPERLLKRHLLFATFAKSLEDAFSFGCIFHVNGNVHAGGFGVASRRAVGAHDVAVANFQRGMHDQILRVGGKVLGHWAFT